MLNKISLQNQLQNSHTSDPEKFNEVFDPEAQTRLVCAVLVNSDSLTANYNVK